MNIARFLALVVALWTAGATADPFLGERVDRPLYERATFNDYAKPYFPKPRLEDIDPWWHPFLDTLFEDGLSPEDLALSRERQKAGDCETVMTLEMKGFFGLHPGAQTDFAEPELRETFETEIVPGYSPGYRRCRAYDDIIAVIQPAIRHSMTDPSYTMSLPRVFPPFRPPATRTATELAFERALLTILSLAVCHRYSPAFEDLKHFRDRFAFQIVYDADLLYLHEQASKVGVSDPSLDTATYKAFTYLRQGGFSVIEDGNVYKILGTGGFVIPDRMSDLCKRY